MIPLVCGSPLPSNTFTEIRRRMVLDYCKWDPQVEDVSVLCPFPLLIADAAWHQLARWSEQLTEETLAAERELLARPDLMGQLGLPRRLVRLFRAARPEDASAAGPRVMRFDFHWTTEGWRISEVNSDVPGGFIEASAFTNLVGHAVPSTMATGDPAGIYARAIAGLPVNSAALVHATAYSDDRQVMIYLAQRLVEYGLCTHLVSPTDVIWSSRQACVRIGAQTSEIDLLVRFFPGEWLPNLGRRSGWERYFVHGQAPISNPGAALLSQSKRLPLVWERLGTRMPTWQSLLPETRDPRHAPWRSDDRWVLKPALGRVGDSIGLHGVTSTRDWTTIRRSVTWWPSHWVAQRRFEMVPLAAPPGETSPWGYPVIGVYTIDRAVAGIYARLASRPLVDHLARDVAVLLPTPTGAGENPAKTPVLTPGVFHD